MYSIEKKKFGYKITFAEMIKEDEMKKWCDESKKALISAPKEFGVFVDMRKLKPLPFESQKHLQDGQKLYKEKGMIRSVVILDNAVLTMQFKRLAQESGIYAWERYLDASKNLNWEKAGIDWLQDSIDPDK